MNRLLLLAALALLGLLAGARSQSCSGSDAQVLRSRRLNTLKANILTQLAPALPDDYREVTTAPPTPEEESVVETFNALRNASLSLERTRERKCQSDDFFAKPVTFFLGSMAPEELQPLVRREAGSGTVPRVPPNDQGNVLSRYRISTDFDLSDNLTDISQADLLLYQEPSALPDHELRDSRQYVEIQAVLDSMNLNQRFVVEGKYVDFWKVGYEVFDITSAVKLWVSKGIHGTVVLEVVIYCYSSSDCAQPNEKGQSPAKVIYSYSTEDTEKAPRIVVVSKNPMEAAHQKRYRRGTEGGSGVAQCRANQSTCCLKPLTIDFHADLGFDFIIQPTQFEANYCEGVCFGQPNIEPALMTPRVFEFISRLGSSNPASSIEPCCAGNEYHSLEVLMKVNGILMIESLQQVIVTSCRCA